MSAKHSWRKLHIAVDTQHIIHGCELTDRFVSDSQMVELLTEQIECSVDHITADGAYDKKSVYNILSQNFKNAKIIIPPHRDAVYNRKNHPQRNNNLQKIKTFGRMV